MCRQILKQSTLQHVLYNYSEQNQNGKKGTRIWEENKLKLFLYPNSTINITLILHYYVHNF